MKLLYYLHKCMEMIMKNKHDEKVFVLIKKVKKLTKHA